MSSPTSITADSPQVINDRRSLLFLSWTIILALTLPQIILKAMFNQDISWLEPARIILLLTLFALTFVWPFSRPLRRFIGIFASIYVFESWIFGNVIQHSQAFTNIFAIDTNLAFLGERLVRLGATFVIMAILLAMGLKRQDFFLKVGNLRAIAQAEKWAIPRKPESWLSFGGRYALIIVSLFLLFMIPALHPSLSRLSVGLVLFAALCALINAFAEEFMYRAALLPQVLPLFSKGPSLLLLAMWFGLGHYFGVPSGVIGVIITAIGGWVFSKAIVETQGLGWSLFLHFISDFTVYLVIFLAGGF